MLYVLREWAYDCVHDCAILFRCEFVCLSAATILNVHLVVSEKQTSGNGAASIIHQCFQGFSCKNGVSYHPVCCPSACVCILCLISLQICRHTKNIQCIIWISSGGGWCWLVVLWISCFSYLIHLQLSLSLFHTLASLRHVNSCSRLDFCAHPLSY